MTEGSNRMVPIDAGFCRNCLLRLGSDVPERTCQAPQARSLIQGPIQGSC